jgi:hypothetical protein
MDAFSDPAFWVAIAGVVGALTALVKAVRHDRNDDAHGAVTALLDEHATNPYGHPKPLQRDDPFAKDVTESS